MNTTKKDNLLSKKLFLIVFSIALILSLSCFVLIYFFLKSPVFVNLIEVVLENSFDKQVKIDSVSISKGSGIVVRDLIIMEKNGVSPLLILPQIKIDLSFQGLRKREIDSIFIHEPSLFLSLWKGEKAEPKSLRSFIPLSFKSGSINNGRVVLVPESDTTITATNINLHLTSMPDEMAKIEGTAFLPDFDSNISLMMGVDMNQLEIEGGHLDVSQMEVKNISGKHLPFLENKIASGSISLSAELLKVVGGLEVEIEAPFRNLKLHGGRVRLLENISGKLSASLLTSSDNQFVGIKADIAAQAELMGEKGRNRVILNGAYDFSNKKLIIGETTLSSSLLGSFRVGGSLTNFPSSKSEYAISIKMHNISLTNIDKYLLTQPGNVAKSFIFNGTGDGTIHINGSLRESLKWETDFSINHPSIHFENILIRPENKPLRLISQGAYNLREDLLTVESLEAEIKELSTLTVHGVLRRVSSVNPELDIAVAIREVSLKGVSNILDGPSAERLKTVDINGIGKIDLTITGDVTSPFIKGNIYLTGDKLTKNGLEIKQFRANIPIKYDRYGLSIMNSLIKAGFVSVNPKSDGLDYSFKDVDIVMPLLEFDDSSVNLKGFELNADNVSINNNKQEIFNDEKIIVKGVLAASFDGETVELGSLSITSGILSGVSGHISLQFGEQAIVKGVVEYDNIEIKKLWTRFQNVPDIVKGYTVNGRGKLSTAFKIVIPEDSLPHLTSNTEFHLAGGEFSSPNGLIMGEGIDLRLTSSIEFLFPLKQAKYNLGLNVTGFELLYGSFYGDFTEKDIKITAKGDYDTRNDLLTLSGAELSLSEIGNLFFSGVVSNLLTSPVIKADIKLPELVNDRAYDFFIKETFQESFPALGLLRINGTTSMKISLEASKDKLKARGKVGIAKMNIVSESPNISIEGVNLSLPVNISYPAIPSLEKSDENQEFGSLVINDARWNTVKISNLLIFPAIRDNDLVFRDDIILPLFGGRTIIRKPYYDEVLSPDRNLFFSIDIEDVDFEDVSVALGMPKFSGTISGTIPEVSFFKSSLVTEGEVILNLFGGKMHVNGISVSNVFSPITSLKSSFEIKNIDLSKVTDTFEFGHISGILDGFIKDLIITNGQAESFTAHIETVKRRGINREISVEALENISIIGSGSSASILNKGIYSFFKKYRYHKIGFRGSLRNDNFLLLGVMIEGNKSYLVKGTLLPPSVNVISYIQNVSFREMVTRLKRVNLIEKSDDTMKTE